MVHYFLLSIRLNCESQIISKIWEHWYRILSKNYKHIDVYVYVCVLQMLYISFNLSLTSFSSISNQSYSPDQERLKSAYRKMQFCFSLVNNLFILAFISNYPKYVSLIWSYKFAIACYLLKLLLKSISKNFLNINKDIMLRMLKLFQSNSSF